MAYGEYGCATETCPLREYLIVVGAEDHYRTPGESLMFMAQAVRYVRLYGGKFDLTTVRYFPGAAEVGATAAQCTAFEDAVTRYGGNVSSASSWAKIATYINSKQATVNGEQKEKRVQVLIFFAHGTPAYGIWLSYREGLFLAAAGAASVDASAFLPEGDVGTRHVTSWACQTGNAGDASKTPEYNMAGSLAQALADMWDIKVYASPTRTNYSRTWGTGLGGRWDDLTGHRRLIDGAVWEPDGADGGVYSTDNSNQGNMPGGMHRFMPGQTSGYTVFNLD